MCMDCKYASKVKGNNRLVCMCEQSSWQYQYVSKFYVCDEFTPKEKEIECFDCELWEQGKDDGTCMHYLNNDCPYGYHDEDNHKIKKFLIDNDLPLPETILYPPLDKTKGNKLLRYEINSNGIFAIVECNENLEITWSLERVKQCTV